MEWSGDRSVPLSVDRDRCGMVGMATTEGRNQLGEFLKARRQELQPTDLGLPGTSDSRRRAQGLRREEVAALSSRTAPASHGGAGRRRCPLTSSDCSTG